MAAISHLLLLRHISKTTPKSHLSIIRNLSITSPSKPTSLSSRLSFVFDHIDKIEKEKAEKDDALQRIKAWRESKKFKEITTNVGDTDRKDDEFGLGFDGESLNEKKLDEKEKKFDGLDGNERKFDGLEGNLMKREVELAHPWPEWVGFMERLVKQNYFDVRRKDEDRMIEGLGGVGGGREFDMGEVLEEGIDFTRDFRTVQAAVLNFGKDRFDILRSLSRQDIQVLVGYGCPSADRRVIFSAKLLRKLVHLDEGDVCSSCNMRTSCEKAYLLTNKEDEARTIDIVRVLLTYGFDPINGSVTNKSLMKQKSVKSVVRKLLYEVAKLGSVPIDPNLPPPVIIKRPPKVKQPPPPPKKRVGRDDIEMKKGDWLCTKCDFMNFAKNLVCLQCDAKRPKRQLLPGEWECPQCNFLNYRRNMSCFHCEHKRPPDEYTENQIQQRQRPSNVRPGPVNFVNRQEVSNAWNFDFDDDESDGADVAVFEHADSRGMASTNASGNQAQNSRGLEDDLYHGRISPVPGKDNGYSSNVQRSPGTGFDDFDDEDDDDVDSYEIDNRSRNQGQDSSSISFSDVERNSDSDGKISLSRSQDRSTSRAHKPPGRPLRRGVSSGSEDDLGIDSDDDLLVQPDLRSSHSADSWQRERISRRPSKGRGVGSDDDDIDDGVFEDKRGAKSRGSGERSFGRGRGSRGGPRSNNGSEFDDFDFSSSHGNRWESRGGDQKRSRRGGHGFNDRDDFDYRRSGRRADRSNGFGEPSRGSYRNGRGSMGDEYGGGQRRNRGGRNTQNFGESRGFKRESMRDEFEGQRGRSNRDMQSFRGSRQRGRDENWSDMDRDFSDDRPRRQRVNVR